MDNPTIGQLRWRVILAQETQTASQTTSGIETIYTDQRHVFADIVPVGTAVYMQGQQVDINAITHRITIRYHADLDPTKFDVVLRDRTRPDGTVNREVYRVHRQAEINGRYRYLILDAELRTDK